MGDPTRRLGGRQVRELLERYGLEPHKTLGQNFLCDPNMVAKIVSLANVGAGDRVIEIGPGLGSLTLGLQSTGASLTLVELDDRLVDPLREIVGRNVNMVIGDARKIDWNTITRAPKPAKKNVAAPHNEAPWTVVANLPYNVASHVVLRVLSDAPDVGRLVVMVQREVAERFVARPGDKNVGIPSVLTSYWGSARHLCDVPPDVFHPRPRVSSSVIEIVRQTQTHRQDHPNTVFPLVKRAFSQRRKTLRKSLKGVVTDSQFERVGLDSSLRPEVVSVELWCALAEAVRDDSDAAESIADTPLL